MNQQKLKITNYNPKPLTFWLEPWGEDYTLSFHESCEILIADGYPHLVIKYTDGLKVYAEGERSSAKVMQDDKELKCGHGRSITKTDLGSLSNCSCLPGKRSTHCELHGICNCCHGALCPQHDELEQFIDL